MTKEEKAIYIEDLASELAGSSVLYLTDTAELTVETINSIRRRWTELKARIMVNYETF